MKTEIEKQREQLKALCKGLKPIQIDAICRKADQMYFQGKTDQIMGRVEESITPVDFTNNLLENFNRS